LAITNKGIGRVSLVVSIILWIALLITDLTILFSDINNLNSGIPEFASPLLLDAFVLSVFIYYRFRIGKAENINFLDLLWKVFVTGLLATVASLVLQLIVLSVGSTQLTGNLFVTTVRYNVNVALITGFLASTYIVWKRLILYQKSKVLIKFWRVYEYTLLSTLVFNVLERIPGLPVNRVTEISLIFLVTLILVAIVLSVNLKWIAYLNFKQKWKSILLLLLVLLYLGYFLQHLQSDIFSEIDRLLQNTFYVSLFTFVALYALFSLLVILFNLPTTSVFEQKLEEVVNFQRLSQSIQTESSEENVYEILMESSISSVLADAAWLEIYSEKASSTFYTHKITEDVITQIKKNIKSRKIKGILDTDTDKIVSASKNAEALKGTRYYSIVAFPIIVQKHQIATLALLKEVQDGFNKEMVEIIRTFVNQAGISIENFRLIEEALENERYKEELAIAKRVQSSLLPGDLDSSSAFEISAFSKSAAEVGGDYYDAFRINEHRTALIVGDVSGKGTSAAFHMSQMKGVFNSLAQMDLTPVEFMSNANKAISLSLEKTSFITLSYFIIDSNKKTVEFSRAGHCPTLFYHHDKKAAEYYTGKGLGLGILRDDNYENHISVTEIEYSSGDILLLYTDGITEAKSNKNDEYGYDRLKSVILENAGLTAKEVCNKLTDSVHSFCNNQKVDDDYTAVIVKFN